MGASSSSSSTKTSQNKGVQQKAFTGVGNLIKLLPTGTVFLFQFLNPVVTNNGKCNTVNKYLDAILIGLCGLSCCFASFTDSYTDSDGNIHYGIVTKNGLWPTSSSSSSTDLSSYKLRFGDFVHAFFAVIVFAGLSLLDTNTVRCFYPEFEDTEKVLLQVLPPVIGVVSGSVFMLFPNTRHGIGYPQSDSTSQNTT
ncbi:hypothetical protein FEM48_Zijuj07G0138200 [Ziziphus jujuba var. spinosa]|nr:hypothetical protein FEM48_Zijuj07G0138200 [Ziziphus jujuba var. spinosa]